MLRPCRVLAMGIVVTVFWCDSVHPFQVEKVVRVLEQLVGDLGNAST